jgi:SAM-dependent methyltransferase
MLFFELIDPEKQLASKDFKVVESFLESTGRTQTGWHYITDLTWIYSNVKHWPRNLRVLDAGGGIRGISQFLLAEMGFSVVNIDMLLLKPYPIYRERYNTKLECLPSFKPTGYAKFWSSDFGSPVRTIKHSIKMFIRQLKLNKAKYHSSHERWRKEHGHANQPVGNIQWVIGNLCKMPEIPADSFDAIVSLSSLEHIPLDSLKTAMSEIQRVLKPNARWAVTTLAGLLFCLKGFGGILQGKELS